MLYGITCPWGFIANQMYSFILNLVGSKCVDLKDAQRQARCFQFYLINVHIKCPKSTQSDSEVSEVDHEMRKPRGEWKCLKCGECLLLSCLRWWFMPLKVPWLLVALYFFWLIVYLILLWVTRSVSSDWNNTIKVIVGKVWNIVPCYLLILQYSYYYMTITNIVHNF